MDEFRLNLLIAGVIIILAIFLFDRRKKASDHRSKSPNNTQPWHSKHDTSNSANHPISVANDSHQKTSLKNTNKLSRKKYIGTRLLGFSKNHLAAVSACVDTDPLIIVLNVMALDGALFDGLRVKSELETLGLRLGENKIFHYYVAHDSSVQPGQSGKQYQIYSVAKIIEPGSFDLNSINSFYTPGLALFMELPGPMEGLLAYELLQNAAVALARGLGGVIYDGSRTKMTPQLANHLKDQISEFTIKMLSQTRAKRG